MSLLTLARAYSRLYRAIRPNGRVRGIGYFIRRIKSDQIIQVGDMQFFFNHAVAGCYPSLISGNFEEPDAHRFFLRIIDALPPQNGGGITFIDVGANVGELAVDVGRHRAVKRVLAFEPIFECARACSVTAALNGLDDRVSVRRVALGAQAGEALFHFNTRSPQASGLTTDAHGMPVQVCTLDGEAAAIDGNCILKIDVEGGELDVLRGGRAFVNRIRPLIVFEYNATTRKYFSLQELRVALPSEYRIFRMTDRGELDEDLSNTWNCVAVHEQSIFWLPCKDLIEATGVRR